MTPLRILVWGFVSVVVFFFAFNWASSSEGSADIKAAVRTPQVIKNESVELEEGQWKVYEFYVSSGTRLDVDVRSNSKPLTVAVMEAEDVYKYQSGQTVSVPQGLSAHDVTQFTGSGVVSAGRWALMVRPNRESAIFMDKVFVTVKVTEN